MVSPNNKIRVWLVSRPTHHTVQSLIRVLGLSRLPGDRSTPKHTEAHRSTPKHTVARVAALPLPATWRSELRRYVGPKITESAISIEGISQRVFRPRTDDWRCEGDGRRDCYRRNSMPSIRCRFGYFSRSRNELRPRRVVSSVLHDRSAGLR